MKRMRILAVALALFLGATTVIYACGNSSKAEQTSTTGNSSSGTITKASQVSVTDNSRDVKAITTDAKAKDCSGMSANCGTSCTDKTKSASACPAMKDGSSAKATKAIKVDNLVKQKSAKAKTVEIRQNNTPLAANQD